MGADDVDGYLALRGPAGTAAQSAGRNPRQHPRGGAGSGRTRRPLLIGRPRRRSVIRRRRQVPSFRRHGWLLNSVQRVGNGENTVRGSGISQCAAAGVWARGTASGSSCATTFPSECARLLHAQAIDVGLIPSIEYLRGPQPYALVPGPAVTSRGPVASVAIYTRREPRDIRTIAMDASSRTSVALATVILRRRYDISPVRPRWRRSRGHAGRLRRRADHRRPGAVPGSRRRPGRAKSTWVRNGRR